MRMAVPMESARPAAEAAIGHAPAGGDEAPIRAAHHFTKQAGAAIAPPHKTHRYRADRRATHHGQDDAARAFHMAASDQILERRDQTGCGSLLRHAAACEASKRRIFHGIVGRTPAFVVSRRNATRTRVQTNRSRRASHPTRTLCPAMKNPARNRRRRNCCGATSIRRDRRRKIRARNSRCRFAAMTAPRFPAISVRSRPAASAHRRRRQWRRCPSAAGPHDACVSPAAWSGAQPA